MSLRVALTLAAGAAALSLAACNRDADTPAADDADAAAETSMSGDLGAGGANGGAGSMASPSTGASSGSMSSGSAMSGGENMSTAAPAGSASMGATVNSDIPADAPSRNTRETAAAPGAANPGQEVPYAYSPTNPAVQAKK